MLLVYDRDLIRHDENFFFFLFFKFFLEGKDLRFNSWLRLSWGLSHTNTHTLLKKLLENSDRDTICNFRILLGCEPHIFLFSILFFTFYTMDFWYFQLRVKKIVAYRWRNDE